VSVRSIVRYCGRFEGPGEDDATPPAVIGTLAKDALVLAIDDPISFPWEPIIGALATPVLVDISGCSGDDRAALEPVLQLLTAADVIIDSTGRRPRVEEIVATVADTAPPDHEWTPRRVAKASLLAERRIAERLEHEYGPVVTVDAVESDDPVEMASTLAAAVPTTSAIAVRLDARSLAPLGSTEALARSLLKGCNRDRVAGMWGIRPGPGHPLERALIVLDGRSP